VKYTIAYILPIEVKYSWFQIFAVFWILYTFFWVFPRRQNELH
jgi:hypothetical protein